MRESGHSHCNARPLNTPSSRLGATRKRREIMRHSIPLALGAAIVASTLTVAAQTNSSSPTSKAQTPATQHKAPSAESKTAMNPDHHFVMEAAEGGMAEV